MNLLATPFARRIGNDRGTSPARRRGRRIPRLGLAERLERRDLLAITAAGIERTTPDQFFTDVSKGMTSEYTAYEITNDLAGPALDVWVKAVFPAGSIVGCGPGYNNEDGIYHVGTLAPGATDAAFLYFTATGLSATPVPYSIEVYSGDPAGGGTLLATKPLSFTSVVNTIEASPNQIETVSFTPLNPKVGDTLDLTVTGYLGNGANRVLFAPATMPSWQPDAFVLRQTAITISGIAQTPDGLFYDGLTDLVNKQPFTAVYSFMVAQNTTTPTPILPTQFTEDGAQDYKHHRVAEAPFPPIPPVVPVLTLTKDDGVTAYVPGGSTTYTITLSNTGLAAANGVVLTDVLPPQLNAATTTWTVSYTNASGTLPAAGTGSIAGTVNLAAETGVIVITLNATILSSALGDLTNTVTATLNGGSLTASDTNTASPLANLTITKTDNVTTVTAGTGTTQTYVLRVRNDGLSDAQGVVVTDTWPAGFQQGIVGPPSQGTVTPGSGGNFTWSLGTLPAGQEATLLVRYTVPASTLPGVYTNTATVTSTTPDSNPVDTAVDTTSVAALADLTITKTDAATAVTAGGGTVQTYTLRVRNGGVSDAQNVTVADTWPAGLTQGTFGTPSQGSVTPGSGGSFTWSLGTLAAGAEATLTVTYTVPASTLPGVYTNTATVTSTTPDPDPANSAVDQTTVIASADLVIEKTDGVTEVLAGGGTTQTYTLRVRNAGVSDAQAVAVSDTWPAGFTQGTFGTPSQGSVTPGSGGNFIWSLGTLPAGQEATLTVAYTVPASTLPGLYTNTATVTSTTPDPDPNNTATDTTRVIASADLIALKDDLTTTVVAGGGTVQTYTLRVINGGESDAQNVVLADAWPAGFQRGAFGTPSQGTITSGPGGNFTWSLGTLPAGQQATLTVAYTVPASTLPGPQTNTATVTSSTPDPLENNTATDTTTVVTSANLVITKDDSASVVTAGDGIIHSYLLRVRNIGPSDAQAVQVADVWPAGFVQGAFGAPSQGTITPDVGGNFTWSLGTLVSGGEATLFVNYTVPASTAAGDQVNTATVTSLTPDPDPANTATDTTTVIDLPDLSITKTNGVTSIVAGGGAVETYTIRVRNGGVSDANGVVVTDTWPAGFAQGAFGTPSQGTVTSGVGGSFTWAVGTLPAGGEATLTVAYSAPASTPPGPQTNIVVASSSDDPETHTASDTTVVVTSANLTISKSDGVVQVTAGGGTVQTYTLLVRNEGVSDAVGVSVADAWPAGFAQGSIDTPSQGTVTPGLDGDFGWSIGTLVPGGTATLTVSYTVPASTLPGLYANVATVTSQTPDPDQDNTATDITEVVASADLIMLKDDFTTIVTAGAGTIQTYTLRVINGGESDAQDVVVTDAWPAGFTQGAFGTPTQGTITPTGGGDFTWTIGRLPAGQQVVVQVSYTVPASTLPGPRTNTATVTSSTPDPLQNNTATDTTIVAASADLVITKDDGVTTVTAGAGTIQTYTIRVRNAGVSDARDVAVADLWPVVFASTGSIVPSQGAVTPGAGGSFTWSVGTLVPGADATLLVSYTVAASVPTGTYTNTATVTSSTPDPDPANTATDTTTVVASADLVITKDDSAPSVVAGSSTVQTYTIRVRNAGVSDARNVLVADTWPTGFTQGAFGTPSQGTVTPGLDGNFTWSLGTLPAGGEATLLVTYTVPASTLPGPYTNVATVTSTTPDPDPSNTAAHTTQVTASANLTITKNDFLASVVAGAGTLQTYRIRVRNDGVSDAQDIVVTDVWPAGFTQGTMGTPTQGTVVPTGAGNFIWIVGRLAPGAIAVLRVGYTVPSTTVPGPVTNRATVTSRTPDPDPNNTATDTTLVVSVADLSVTKADGDAPYVPGTPITYTITGFNAGPSTVFGTSISDPLPPKTTFVSATGGAVYDPATRTVTFPVGTLGPGGSQAFFLTLLTDPDRRGDLLNTVTIAVPAGVTDPNLANNVFIDPAGANPLVALGVTKTDGTDIYHPGGTTTYTITVTNSGPSTMLGGTVSDLLPALATGGSWSVATSGAGTVCTPTSGTGSIAASLDLPPGGIATFTYTIGIKPDALTNLVNTVTVTPPADTTGGAVSATDTNVVSIVSALVLGTDDGCNLTPWVKILDPVSGALIRKFLAYDPTFIGSVRVATGDLTGDGIAEIVTGPGRNLVGEIRVFTQQGVELPQYRTLPFGAAYRGGVEVAVGDVDGDGTADLIAGQSVNAGLVNVFKVTAGATDPVADTPFRSFRPFAAPYALGVMVSAGDFGTYSGGVRTSPTPDGRAEIVVGTNAGTRATVRIYDASSVTPRLVRTILPFASTFTGGVTLSTGRFNADAIDDVMIGAGVGGGSVVEVYDGATWALRKRIDAFASFGRPNAAVFAAMLDMDGNGVADDVYGVQGRNATGGSNGVRRWNRVTNTTTTLPLSTTNAPPLRVASIKLAR